MKIQKSLFLALFMALLQTSADTRRFTYTYEPETIPEGGTEFEQCVTLRRQRNKIVGQENYNRWDIREEFEYGVTDRYSVSLYLNGDSESFRDPGTGNHFSKFRFDGVSV